MTGTKYVDLHIHTNASDGDLSPTEVVKRALKSGLEAIAITDHDTLNGVEEALNAGKRYGLEVVPGVEISCHYKEREFHLVGLYIDYKHRNLKNTLKRLSDGRINYVKKTLEKLNREFKKEGIYKEVYFDDVLKYTKEATSMGRPMIAKAMLEKGIVTDYREAFNKYLSKKELLAPKAHFSIEDAICAVHNANGLAILAHPMLQYERDRKKEQTAQPNVLKEIYDTLTYLKNKGLDGVECSFSLASQREIKYLLKVSKKLNLVPSGGTDWHSIKSLYPLGSMKIPYSILETLKKHRK